MSRPVAIVTGGSRGIGRACVETAARQGYDVVLHYRSDDASAAQSVAKCEAVGAQALAVKGDVATEADVVALFTLAHQRFGGIDAVINNAGMLPTPGPLATAELARLQRVFAVNAIGAFLVAREAVRAMLLNPRENQSIVNISSRAAVLGGAGEFVDYAGSKAAVDALTTGLAKEVAEHGIRVNGIRPGLIDTDIHASVGDAGRVERLGHTVALGRAGTAQEVASAVLWLASREASYVTGVTFDVSGGR